jgi:mannose-1-phosphate guanylyltransferase
MSHPNTLHRHRWALVLAGGHGTRLRDESVKLYGYHRPKQYCQFLDEQTLIEATFRRAEMSVDRDRIAVVTSREHEVEADEALTHWPEVLRVDQPENAETTAGILLPALEVLDRDPHAVLMVLPSDHAVTQPRRFMRAMDEAADLVESRRDLVAMLAADGNEEERDYGWLVPDSSLDAGGRWQTVRSFHEKPSTEELRGLLRDGARINTFSFVVAASTLVRMVAELVPDIHEAVMASRHSHATLTHAYRHLRRSNFSREVLERAAGKLVMAGVDGTGWTDVGTPERLGRVRPSETARSLFHRGARSARAMHVA